MAQDENEDSASRFVAVPSSQRVTVPVLPLKVNVPFPIKNLRVPVPDKFMAVPLAVSVMFIGPLAAKSSVPVKAPAVSETRESPLTADATVTTPPPDEPLKVTSSPVVGAEAPLAPPDVADQFVVEDKSQVPVPPTQNLDAIVQPLYL